VTLSILLPILLVDYYLESLAFEGLVEFIAVFSQSSSNDATDSSIASTAVLSLRMTSALCLTHPFRCSQFKLPLTCLYVIYMSYITRFIIN
jgi:hypothetical protein